METLNWQAPAALTHATWQTAYAQCSQAALRSESDSLSIDWQHCTQVDSSALAFILDLKRGSNKRISHQQAPLQLAQLARLYEVEQLVGL